MTVDAVMESSETNMADGSVALDYGDPWNDERHCTACAGRRLKVSRRSLQFGALSWKRKH